MRPLLLVAVLLVGCSAAPPIVHERSPLIQAPAADSFVTIRVHRSCLPLIGVKVDSVAHEGQTLHGPFLGLLCRKPVQQERWYGPAGKVG